MWQNKNLVIIHLIPFLLYCTGKYIQNLGISMLENKLLYKLIISEIENHLCKWKSHHIYSATAMSFQVQTNPPSAWSIKYLGKIDIRLFLTCTFSSVKQRQTFIRKNNSFVRENNISYLTFVRTADTSWRGHQLLPLVCKNIDFSLELRIQENL